MKSYPQNATTIYLLSFILLFSCAQASNPADNTNWLDTADPVEDANNAIKNKDYRLLGLAMRAIKVPGVKSENQTSLIEKCGVRLLQGSGDIIRGEADLQMKKTLHIYARNYNNILKKACMANQ